MNRFFVDYGPDMNEFVGFMKEPDEKEKKNLPCEQAGDDEQESQEGFDLAQRVNTKLGGRNPVEKPDQEKPRPITTAPRPQTVEELRSETDDEYAKKIPNTLGEKKKIWSKMRANRTRAASDELPPDDVSELEYVKLEKQIKDEDRFHWRVGQVAIDDEQTRMDYYALHLLALNLNRARWKVLDVQQEKGKSATGVNMRAVFWKESCHGIIDKGSMPRGQFVDGHPVLRPFASVVKRHTLTKAFLRGFVDARLRVMPQPASVKQAVEHYDKAYGYFFNTQLELLGIRNDVAEHLMTHVGRALGLTQHCVLLWREYALKGATMLPADVCADNHINLALLKNVRMAKIDRCVRRALLEVLYKAKLEMDHVRNLAPHAPSAMWPLLMECLMPNYYIRFLERNDCDVGRWFSDQQYQSPGFQWFFYKQMFHWMHTKELETLVREEAPIPYLPQLPKMPEYGVFR